VLTNPQDRLRRRFHQMTFRASFVLADLTVDSHYVKSKISQSYYLAKPRVLSDARTFGLLLLNEQLHATTLGDRDLKVAVSTTQTFNKGRSSDNSEDSF